MAILASEAILAALCQLAVLLRRDVSSAFGRDCGSFAIIGRQCQSDDARAFGALVNHDHDLVTNLEPSLQPLELFLLTAVARTAGQTSTPFRHGQQRATTQRRQQVHLIAAGPNWRMPLT